MEKLSAQTVSLTNHHPARVIQFGGGNFLRGFADWVFFVLNQKQLWQGRVVIVQSTGTALSHTINEQSGLYHLVLKGYDENVFKEDTMLIDVIERSIHAPSQPDLYFDLATQLTLDTIVSNTTEAGIQFNPDDRFTDQPAASFPGKLTQLLYKRFEFANGNKDAGFTIIPCELINNNGDALKEIVLQYATLWKLGSDFEHWIHEANTFHNTLVDRIVPGFPKAEAKNLQAALGYEDALLVTAEQFHLWVIEGDNTLDEKFGFSKSGLNVVITDSIQPYRETKVRILNGAHTAMVPVSLMYGNATVQQTIENQFTAKFISDLLFTEILPTLNLPADTLKKYAATVLERFKNPSIIHQLSSIALNAISKFKVRNLPSLIQYFEAYDTLPFNLSFSFACLIRFYKGEWHGETMPVQDEESVKQFFSKIWSDTDTTIIAGACLRNETLWGMNVADKVPPLEAFISQALIELEKSGVESAYHTLSDRYSENQ